MINGHVTLTPPRVFSLIFQMFLFVCLSKHHSHAENPAIVECTGFLPENTLKTHLAQASSRCHLPVGLVISKRLKQ